MVRRMTQDEHDDRYARGEEWWRIVNMIWSGGAAAADCDALDHQFGLHAGNLGSRSRSAEENRQNRERDPTRVVLATAEATRSAATPTTSRASS